ncbi:hypothetical protein GCM10028818_01020 [Spirosoma horti]
MLEQEIKDFIDSVVVDYKYLIGQIGNLGSLPADVTKTSVVAALISLNNKIANAAGINDAVTATGSTWSSTKISSSISTAINALVDGAPAALDTLKELATQLNADKTVLDSVVTALAKRVSVSAVQSFTADEKKQARENIDAVSTAQLGNPSFDFAAYYAQQKAA